MSRPVQTLMMAVRKQETLHMIVATRKTHLMPILSSSSPAGICMSTYDQPKLERTMPISPALRPKSSRMWPSATAIELRSM